jgi:hypothetical protein
MSSAVLFTGHRVDASDRPTPRFPVACAATAARDIANALPQDAGNGISSAANGGDILFLEACVARAIPCHIILPFPPEEFLRRSVATEAPGGWEAKFHHLWSNTPTDRRHILTVPKGTNPYAACNDALLALADELGAPEIIALWDGQTGDGPGGTADLIAKARAKGWPVTVITP